MLEDELSKGVVDGFESSGLGRGRLVGQEPQLIHEHVGDLRWRRQTQHRVTRTTYNACLSGE